MANGDMNSDVLPLIQKALNLMETTSIWSRKAAKKAHIVGLQGEKRRLRWLYREARDIVDCMEHSAYDTFRVDIWAHPGSVDVESITSCETGMITIIEKLWIIYNEAHQIANDLVVAKGRPFATKLYCYADKLFCIICTLQRNHSEYQLAKYEYHHVSRYQVSWCNIHDEYEKKEQEQGYDDSHA